ncbi:beta/gamma crystallin domain-containing protein [Nonomuraea rubra]|uniref:Streptomyces killer toxin-like beta/gamma crystallin domain-containing protein n=1 Tax=Nonomuraea rubra TaxID=46180 RepID=A0A7X0P3Z0_9ACTN|nr:beta/gamma crystallin domain-containing protein [Nonomuraea rubra]MBB6554825.1 hypothetical protein [Nonomuraea rubra]
MRKLPAILSAVAAAAMVGLAAPPAYAIDKVTCRDGAGYLEIYNETRHCFANAGRTNVYITNVNMIAAGNNNVTIYYRVNSNTTSSAQMNKWAVVDWREFRLTITGIEIH